MGPVGPWVENTRAGGCKALAFSDVDMGKTAFLLQFRGDLYRLWQEREVARGDLPDGTAYDQTTNDGGLNE
jgi:hypothetical protein